MARYGLIKDGVVDNVVEWDGDTNKWQPPADIELVLMDEGEGFGVGDLYTNGVFERPHYDAEVDADGYMTYRGVRMLDENGQWITAEVYYA